MRGGMKPVGQYYDWHSRDFFTIASRNGEAFQPAEKSHEIGEQMLNVLFKNEMLAIYDLEELRPLMEELKNLQEGTNKTKAKDDFIDSLRYAITRIPWDWSAIKSEKLEVKKQKTAEELMHEARMGLQSVEEQDAIFNDHEFDALNELYEV
jgi:hypothetical protein